MKKEQVDMNICAMSGTRIPGIAKPGTQRTRRVERSCHLISIQGEHDILVLTKRIMKDYFLVLSLIWFHHCSMSSDHCMKNNVHVTEEELKRN